MSREAGPRRGIADAEAPAAAAVPRRVLDAPPPPLAGRRAALVLGGLALLIVVAVAIAATILGGRPAPAGPGPATTPSPSPSGPSVTPSTSPPPAASTGTAEMLQLNDATLSVPHGWSVQDDEVVQDGRRLVRLREDVTDARVQAVTLTSVAASLEETCRTLVADLTGSYTGVEDTAPAAVEVSADGEGVACSFTGERSSDEVGNTVTFTVLRRAADDHALVFRATVPTALPDPAPTTDALERMLCTSAASFDVEIARCAAG